MKIDTLNLIISDIESELKKYSKECLISKTEGILFGSMGAFLALSILVLPRWASLIIYFVFVGLCYFIYYKWAKKSTSDKNLRNYISNNLTKLKNACYEFEEKEEIPTIVNPTSSPMNSDSLPQNISSIVLPLQRLENTSICFGEKYHSIVYEELTRVLRKYQLEFIEYSEETKDCYDYEEADINEITYASLAIVKKNRNLENRVSPIILKGKVFIPYNNKI